MLFLIVVIVTVGQISNDIYLPSFNSMSLYYGVPIHLIERTIVMFMIGFTIGTLITGPLSDQYGRKNIILISLFVAAIASFLCGIAPNIEFLWTVRFIQGFAISACTTLARAISKDISANAQEMAKLASVNGVMYAIAISIAPLFGGFIESHFHNWHLTFFALGTYLLVLLVFVNKQLRETNLNKIHISWKKYFINYIHILTNLRFLKYSSISGLALAGEFAYLTIAPNLLQNLLGLSPQDFSCTVLIVAIALGLAGVINNIVVKIYGIDLVLKYTGILMVIITLILVLFALFHFINVWGLLIPVFIFLIGAGSCFSNGSSGAISIFQNKAGSASSAYSCIQMLGGMIGSYSVTCLPHNSSLGMSIVMFLFAVLILLISRSK